jgi:hypothetical protein
MAKPGTTRRRVLGVAATLPFLPFAPVRAEPVEALPLADREAWDRNLARYRDLAARAKKAEETGWGRASYVPATCLAPVLPGGYCSRVPSDLRISFGYQYARGTASLNRTIWYLYGKN